MFRRRNNAFNLESATQSAFAVLQQHDKSRYPFISNVHLTLKQGVLGVHDRWIVTLRESVPGQIHAAMRDTDARRSSELSFDAHSEAELKRGIEDWYIKIDWWRDRLSVYRLEPDKQYIVLKEFTDYYKNVFQSGQLLTYVGQNFLPYEGGYTISFKEAKLYLQETENSDILADFDLYFAAHPLIASR